MAEGSQLQLLLQQDVISGFSYSFAKALLEKLKALKTEDRLEEKIARSVIIYLEIQMGQSLRKVDDLIAVTEEFLSIFEKKE